MDGPITDGVVMVIAMLRRRQTTHQLSGHFKVMPAFKFCPEELLSPLLLHVFIVNLLPLRQHGVIYMLINQMFTQRAS